jgi:hypothetical protein
LLRPCPKALRTWTGATEDARARAAVGKSRSRLASPTPQERPPVRLADPWARRGRPHPVGSAGSLQWWSSDSGRPDLKCEVTSLAPANAFAGAPRSLPHPSTVRFGAGAVIGWPRLALNRFTVSQSARCLLLFALSLPHRLQSIDRPLSNAGLAQPPRSTLPPDVK